MAEKQTAARPYAEAVFAHAKERGSLTQWSDMLALIQAIAADAGMTRLAVNPRIDRAGFRDLFIDICGGHIDAHAANFVRLLVENGRMALLPEIVAQFERLKAADESRIEASVVSAFALEPGQLSQLEQALRKKYGRDVHLTASTDSALVGGVVIRVGDTVIDGSVRGRINDLAASLRT